MYTPSRDEFRDAATRGNLIPVYRELLADGDTPVSAYAALGGGAHSFLLESVVGGATWAAYSFVGVAPRAVVRWQDGTARVTWHDVDGGGPSREASWQTPDPTAALHEVLGEMRPVSVPGLPRFWGGAVGWIAYDCVRAFEDLPARHKPALALPPLCMVVTDTLVIFDNLRQTLKVVATPYVARPERADAAYDRACARIDDIVAALRAPRRPLAELDLHSAPPFGGAARSGEAGPIDLHSAPPFGGAARSGEAGPIDLHSAPPFGGAARSGEAGPIDLHSAPPFGGAARSGEAGPIDLHSAPPFGGAARSGEAGPIDLHSAPPFGGAARSGEAGPIDLHSAPPFGGAARSGEAGPIELGAVARELDVPVSTFGHDAYVDAVAKAQDYILAGDAFQVVLSQRFAQPQDGARPLDVYRALRVINPSPYMFHLEFPEARVTGASPETLVRLSDGRVELRPIAGTRPRGANLADDERFARELAADPKELAEHLMLVDLGRNDVGRVAETGSVQVAEHMVIERYSHVMHLVSHVVGALAPGNTWVDVLRAAFPAGTLSGAPKIRAMEIIDELEPEQRGIYGGAVGYVSYTGNLDLAIAIRTLVETAGTIYVQAGAGIVADSQPEAEYQECLNKARAALRAVAIARTAREGA